MADMPAPPSAKSRERVLNDAELAAVWKASAGLAPPFDALIRLLIATGQRRSEVAGLDWAEIDREAGTWTIPAERAKTGVAHRVPLNGLALAILDSLGARERRSGFVFTTTGKTPVSGFSKQKRRLDEMALARLRKDMGDADATIAPWRLHDLRRTLATGLQRLGIRLEVTEAVLGHVSGSRAGIVGVYQRHDWADEKRAALDAWAAHVERLLAGKSAHGNVHALKGRGVA